MIISSLQNPKIKHLKQLQNKGYRDKHQQFIAQGLTTCATLLEAGYTMAELFMTQEMYHKHQETFAHVSATELITPELAAYVSTTITTSGIIAIFNIKEHSNTINANSIVLDSIQDPGNVGTIIRTAAAMGIEHVVLIQSADVYSPKVIQATTGCLANLNIICTTWDNFKSINNHPLCAFVVDSAIEPNAIPLEQAILVFGNEGQGLASSTISECNYQVTIPMPGKTESLNAAVAASIGIYLKSQRKS